MALGVSETENFFVDDRRYASNQETKYYFLQPHHAEYRSQGICGVPVIAKEKNLSNPERGNQDRHCQYLPAQILANNKKNKPDKQEEDIHSEIRILVIHQYIIHYMVCGDGGNRIPVQKVFVKKSTYIAYFWFKLKN